MGSRPLEYTDDVATAGYSMVIDVRSPAEYALELEAFADTVAGRTVGPTTGRSERRTLAIIQAGAESAQSGQPVDLQEHFGEL